MPTVVESIRSALSRRDGISEESMRPLATVYAAEVERVNERLSSAVALLHKGLRSEAIQSVSMAPNAMDAAAALDFVEADEWLDILQFLEIPVPPPLNRELVEELNEAIVEAQPLEGLLRQQRRLAIARAPLPWRLKVLRRIAERDPGNGVWRDDLESWEKVRLQQIQGEATHANGMEGLPALRGLQKELDHSPWVHSPGANLIKFVRQKHQKLIASKALVTLKELAPRLHDAFCAMNEAEARALRTQWDAAAESLGQQLPPELTEETQDALGWLAQLDHRAEQRRLRAVAVGRLEAALDQDAPLGELEKAYRQAANFDEPIPPDLLQRYQVTVADQELATKRRFQIIVASIAVTAAVLLFALGLWQWESMRVAQEQAATKELEALIDAGDTDAALSFLKQIGDREPRVADSTGVRSLANRLDSLVAQEGQRVEQFRAALAQASADDPASTDLVALGRAERLAVTEAEKAAAFEVRNAWSRWDAENKGRETEALLAEVQKIQQRLDQIESDGPDPVGLATLDAVLPELEGLLSEHPRANSAARFQVSALRNRAVSMRGALKTQLDRSRMEAAALSQLYGAQSLAEYAGKLQRFTRQASETSLAKQFKEVLEDQPIWEKALTWNDVVVTAVRAVETGMPSEAVEAYRKANERLTASVGKNLTSFPATFLEPFERYDERQQILDGVLGGLPDTVVADLVTLTETSGDRSRWFIYKTYFEQNRQKILDNVPKGLTVDIVSSEGGAVESRFLKADVEVLPEPYSTIRWLSSVGDAKRQDFLADWEGQFLRLTAELRGRDQLGSRLKEMMLQHLLAGACEGSEMLAGRLGEELLFLKARSDSLPPWYTPLPFRPSLAPEVDAQVVSRLADLYRRRPNFSEIAALVREQRYRWVGFLEQPDPEQLSIHLDVTPDGDGRLAIARPSRADKELADWIEIGEFRAGEANLHAPKEDVLAGLPVFYLPGPIR